MKKMNKYFTSLLVLSGLLAIFYLTAGHASAAAEECDKECRRELAVARAATAKYHDVQEALADGYQPIGPCVEVPGLGAMGIHYINFSRAGNPNVDAAEPEVLLYIPDEDGDLRLIGMEYVVSFAQAPTAPTLFGRQYHADSPRNQWSLHVWAWRHNPNGMFANFNPKVSCP